MNATLAGALDADGALDEATGFEHGLEAMQSGSDRELRSLFEATREKQDFRLVGQGFRAFSATLLARGLIAAGDYAGLFGGHTVHQLTRNSNGQFVHLRDQADARMLARRYSLAKHGSIEDIRFLAGIMVSDLRQALDHPGSALRRMFETARDNEEQVVMLTTGWRNVPSTANVLYDIVVEHLNISLAYRALPTIINVKLPRIAPPCENYASLSLEERERISAVQDHILPAKNFYASPGVHVLFGDDVLVTGATADKVYAQAMRNGAKSFMSVYPILLDPLLALGNPATEEDLNTTLVTGRLDDTFAAIVGHPEYIPILRSLRTLLGEHNRSGLDGFLRRIPLPNVLKLYVSALGNEFLFDARCAGPLDVVRRYLTQAGVLDGDGYPCQGVHA